MSVTFEYRLQIEAKGKTALGREMSFLMELPYTHTVEETNHNAATAKIVNKDMNGDFVPESLLKMIESPLQEYCSRYSILFNTVSILSYTVSTEHHDVVVFFNPIAPSKRTENGEDSIRAYLIRDLEAPPEPTNVRSMSTPDGISLSWSLSGHYHGVRIYDQEMKLIASLGEDAYEWTDVEAEANRLYSYYIASYHSKAESPLVKISGRLDSGIDSEIPQEENDVSSIRKPISREDRKMAAFQSGVGDGEDLQVNPMSTHVAQESFSYTMQIKGYENKQIHIFPRREFQYRIVAHNAYGIQITETPWRVGTIDGKLPFNEEGAGRDNLRIPLEMEIPAHETNVEFTVEVIDPSGFVQINLDKGVPPSTRFQDDFVTFSARLEAKEPLDIQVPFYGPIQNGKGSFTVKEKNTLYIEQDIKSAYQEVSLSNPNISEWMIVLQSSNPNVKLTVIQEPDDYKPNRNFIRFTMAASIINHTQSPWNPSIHAGYYYLNQAEHYLYGQSEPKGLITDDYKFIVTDQNEVFVSPIPKQGAPIIVRDHSGKEMTHVFFYENGKPTLQIKEELTTNERNELMLSHLGIDPETLECTYVDEQGQTVEITDYIQEENYLKLYPSVKPQSNIHVTYKLMQSFIVDYNYDTVNDVARIELHGAVLDETKELEIFYETNVENSFHVAREIDLNPLQNVQNAGFVYLTDTLERAQELELYIGNHTMFATGKDTMYIRAIAKDRLGNPVAGNQLTFKAVYGSIEMIQSETDRNGLAKARYIAPSFEVEDIISVIDYTDNLSKQQSLFVKRESPGSHIALSTSYPTVYPGMNEVKVTAYLFGENQEPEIGKKIRFEFDSGIANRTEAVTDQFGAASIVFAASEIPPTGIIRLRAKCDELQVEEDTILRIHGFRHYHKDYFMRNNNLLDIQDRIAARQNLGIVAQSAEPKEAEMFDLWLDQGDLLFVQQSYQLRDLESRQESRENLGIHTFTDEPKSPWANDMWIEKDKE